MQENPEQTARGETPVILHADEAAFFKPEETKAFDEQLARIKEGLDVTDPELANAIAEREAQFFSPVPTTDDVAAEGAAEEADRGTLRQIGETNYFLHEAANGYQQIVVDPKGPGRLTGDVVAQIKAVQEGINQHNESLGHPVTSVDRVMMTLAAQAMRQRQFSSQAAAQLPENHPFEIKRRLKAKGLDPNSRNFRRLFRKEVEKNLRK
jgi:hypothetical protein